MTSMCLVDTSSWVHALRRDGDTAVRERVRAAMREGRACLCGIVTLELWNGARGEAEKRDLAKLELGLPCLETDRQTWSLANRLARECRSAGITVPATDLLVYACARRHEVDLEQADEDFARIRSVDGAGETPGSSDAPHDG